MLRNKLIVLLKLTILFVFIPKGQCGGIGDRVERLESIIEDLILENRNLKKRVEDLENTLEVTHSETLNSDNDVLLHKLVKNYGSRNNNSEDVIELQKKFPVLQGHTNQRRGKRMLLVLI